MSTPATIRDALKAARDALLAERGPSSHWVGELSSSALSTATAALALWAAGDEQDRPRVQRALAWLEAHQNADGGWGDSAQSPSNISTSLLAWSALAADPSEGGSSDAKVREYLRGKAGSLDGAALAAAVTGAYGEDRTFSAPILMACALAGRLGPPDRAWSLVATLPFELAACPQGWLKSLGLPVVSYALPALIAVGQAVHHHRRPGGVAGAVRNLLRGRTLHTLQEIQPSGGGFLEAAPLTSFVVMALASMGLADHPVARRGAEFLRRTVRADGSWPIDTNLATWVSTLAVSALADAGGNVPDAAGLRDWLLGQQWKVEHPYTRAAAGGWAWTDLSGAVCDADDTAGALIALNRLGEPDATTRQAIRAGLRWLADLQNSDGGIPTFCRGWGKLPFDRSSPDLTAHALAAWSAWGDQADGALARRLPRAMARAIDYLQRSQRAGGSWSPLWFGNQRCPDLHNLTYGTARVVGTLAGMLDTPQPPANAASIGRMIERGVAWLLQAQSEGGGWGGDRGVELTIEETALAVGALASAIQNAGKMPALHEGGTPSPHAACLRGAAWLVDRTGGGRAFAPAPIGLYFAKLWYHERLYPIIFTVSALGKVVRMLS